jgi:adenylyl-sulfate kinase
MKNGLVYWFTGLSGAGKTTLAERVRDRLMGQKIETAILDGDDVRNRLHRHLGFSEAEIKENNALITGLCESERKRSDVVLVPIISPYAVSRAKARGRLAPGFFEIHVRAEIPVLEERDTKGLYSKARNGEMDNLIGYSPGTPYEAPEAPDLIIDAGRLQLDLAVDLLLNFILSRVLKQDNP